MARAKRTVETPPNSASDSNPGSDSESDPKPPPNPDPGIPPSEPIVEPVARADGAPLGAPQPPDGVDKDGRAIGHHWDVPKGEWRRNRGRRPGSKREAKDAPPIPPVDPNAKPGPESREARGTRWQKTRCAMSEGADELFPYARMGVAIGNAFTASRGLDLSKIPVHAIKIARDGSPAIVECNAADGLARSFAELTALALPTLAAFPAAAPIVSILAIFGGIVIYLNTHPPMPATGTTQQTPDSHEPQEKVHSGEVISVTNASGESL